MITLVSPLVSSISCWVSVSYQYRSFRPKKYQYSISIEVRGPGKYQYSISIEFSDLGSICIVSVSKKRYRKALVLCNFVCNFAVSLKLFTSEIKCLYQIAYFFQKYLLYSCLRISRNGIFTEGLVFRSYQLRC